MKISTDIKGNISEKLAVELLPSSRLNPTTQKYYRHYDIDWDGKTVEVKMSTTYPRWKFHSGNFNNGAKADYHLLIGYKQNKPYKGFLIPSNRIPKNGVIITANGKSKYFKYEIKILGNLIERFIIPEAK